MLQTLTDEDAAGVLVVIGERLKWVSRPARRGREYGQWWDTLNLPEDEGYVISPDIDDNYNLTGEWAAYRDIGIHKRGIPTLASAKAACEYHYVTGKWDVDAT